MNDDVTTWFGKKTDIKTVTNVSGIISQETYDWAITLIQAPADPATSAQITINYLPIVDHARWIIDRVHDGTLAITTETPQDES